MAFPFPVGKGARAAKGVKVTMMMTRTATTRTATIRMVLVTMMITRLAERDRNRNDKVITIIQAVLFGY